MKKIIVKPTNNKILVEDVGGGDKTEGGIYLPNTARAKTKHSIVRSISNDCHLKDIKEGDKLLCAEFGGTPVPELGEKFRIIDAVTVIATVYEGKEESAKD